MKIKNTVLVLGILSIIILITAQLIIIRGVWKQKDEMLYLRYMSLSQEASATLRGIRNTGVYDTVRFILDNYSATAAMELSRIQDKQQLEEKKQEIFRYFSTVLNMEQDFSTYLSDYFETRGFDKNFMHRIEISNLDIMGTDTINIYRSDTFRFRRSPADTSTQAMRSSKSTILVNRPWFENNFYSLSFDYYIDFSDKQKMILKEISASLSMSIFSIIVVMVIFMVAYHNLMEEKRLSSLKTDFINNMTHELKTPLATITVAGKTLEMQQIRNDDAKILETARLIGKQSVHLNQLINMILEISMWERTQFQLDKAKVNIAEAMNDIVSGFKTGCGNCAELSQKYNFQDVKADIDIVYFTTMINNLLSNAVKYSDKDPVIKVEGFTENNNICISITDNGIGINKNDQKHVFDKFYRASSGNIHKYKGLGLGLYYVKKIAAAHGGDVTLNSKPGKGSIFTITLPYK